MKPTGGPPQSSNFPGQGTGGRLRVRGREMECAGGVPLFARMAPPRAKRPLEAR